MELKADEKSEKNTSKFIAADSDESEDDDDDEYEQEMEYEVCLFRFNVFL